MVAQSRVDDDKPLLSLAELKSIGDESARSDIQPVEPGLVSGKQPNKWTSKQVEDLLHQHIADGLNDQTVKDSLKDWSDKSGWEITKLWNKWSQLSGLYNPRQMSSPQQNNECSEDSPDIKLAAEKLANSNNLFDEFMDDLKTVGYLTEKPLAYSLLITHGARLLPRSSGFIFHGASSSGKSDAVLTGSLFLPPENVKNVTATSAQAFFYMGDLQHCLLILGEVKPERLGFDDPRQEAWRQLISENKIVRRVVEKVDGRMNEGVDKITEGPCVVVATTTTEPNNWNDEFANRNMWIRSNDSEAMTARVLDLLAQRAENPWQNAEDMKTAVLSKWRAFHRILKPLPVRIPFATQIKPINSHVTARRLFTQLRDHVFISALLHQHTREYEETNGIRYVVATGSDYQIAYDLLDANAPRVLELCSKPALQAYEQLQSKLTGKSRTTGEVQQLLQQPRATVCHWLQELVDAGLLTIDGKQGRQNLYALGVPVDDNQKIGLIPPGKISVPARCTEKLRSSLIVPTSNNVSIATEQLKSLSSKDSQLSSQLLTVQDTGVLFGKDD